jgi:hypothetical protein
MRTERTEAEEGNSDAVTRGAVKQRRSKAAVKRGAPSVLYEAAGLCLRVAALLGAWLLYCCFTAALLLLYCCFTAALLLLYCCFTAAVRRPASAWLRCSVRGCFTAALLLLYYCFTAALLLLYCCFTAALLLLYYCFTAALLLLYCCCTTALLLLYCCFTSLLLYCVAASV